MADAVLILTFLGVILLVGIFCTYLANRLKIPNVLFLIIAGILLSFIKKDGEQLIQFPLVFLASAAVLALVMIIFDSTSKFNLKEFGELSFSALKLTSVLVIAFLAILTISARYIFGIESWTLSFLFAAIMIGTDPSSVIAMFGGEKKLVPEFLEVESIINTPLTVLLPFMVIDFANSLSSGVGFSALDQIAPFLRQVVTGIGAGVLIAIIAFRFMKKFYSKVLSPVSILASALITYVLAESLGGSGVLAVTALGLFFGNVYIREKEKLKTFGSFLSNTFEILVFVLLGLMIKLPTQGVFYLKVGLIFFAYLIVRYVVVMLIFRKSKLSKKEKTFIALNSSKGVATAVVIFLLLTKAIPGMELILELSIMFIIYSIVFSTIMSKFSKRFLFHAKTAAAGVEKVIGSQAKVIVKPKNGNGKKKKKK